MTTAAHRVTARTVIQLLPQSRPSAARTCAVPTAWEDLSRVAGGDGENFLHWLENKDVVYAHLLADDEIEMQKRLEAAEADRSRLGNRQLPPPDELNLLSIAEEDDEEDDGDAEGDGDVNMTVVAPPPAAAAVTSVGDLSLDAADTDAQAAIPAAPTSVTVTVAEAEDDPTPGEEEALLLMHLPPPPAPSVTEPEPPPTTVGDTEAGMPPPPPPLEATGGGIGPAAPADPGAHDEEREALLRQLDLLRMRFKQSVIPPDVEQRDTAAVRLIVERNLVSLKRTRNVAFCKLGLAGVLVVMEFLLARFTRIDTSRFLTFHLANLSAYEELMAEMALIETPLTSSPPYVQLMVLILFNSAIFVGSALVQRAFHVDVLPIVCSMTGVAPVETAAAAPPSAASAFSTFARTFG